TIRLGILEIFKIGAAGGRARMPLLIGILDQIKSERRHTGIKPMFSERIAHDREVHDSVRHFDAGVTEFLSHDGRELLERCATAGTEEFKLELDAIFIPDAVPVVIFPASLIK